MDKVKVRETLLRITEGTISTAVDFTLYLIYLSIHQGIGTFTSQSAWLKHQKATRSLEEINYQTLKNAFYRLKSEGLIKTIENDSSIDIRITALGKKRLSAQVPFYQEERPWRGKLYLINYDIPEKHRHLRDKLRKEILQPLHCGLLQASLWITPYNPTDFVESFSLQYGLGSFIIISEVGPQGVIGGLTFSEMIKRAYPLERVAESYTDFIEKYQSNNNDRSRMEFDFLACVKTDPQLPFELLPEDWPSPTAFQIYRTV